ncbi:lysophospholipid acyltransferase family protein [Fodinicola acaciae]|uniref:lysophospholipid acyltransferase family protein n=1 Tax=Fodinicola acaciae TaxID=2681555 RepID=UPI0013D0696A|nr:lysophospholipid acyltransferase family protein [Fodinicola acaciae]
MPEESASRKVIPLPARSATGRTSASTGEPARKPGVGDRLASRTGNRTPRRQVIPTVEELRAVSSEPADGVPYNGIEEPVRQPATPAPIPEPRVEADPPPAADEPEDRFERFVAGALRFARRRLSGEYRVDEFGFDPDLTDNVMAPLVRPLFEKWFRVDVHGLHNVPDTGGALLVANHAGTMMPMDAAMIMLALLDKHPAHRHMRTLAADLVFSSPLIGALARKAGGTLACNEDAERLLAAGELVGVFPEGFKGIGKPFSERYKLQRFGRGGFVTAALHSRVPIIPVSVVGSEEIYPKLADVKILARLLGLPYFPLTPTFPWLGPLGLVPLPSKWIIEFGTPIPTTDLPDAADDPMLVLNLGDQVRETIQQTLYRLLLTRRTVFG